MFVSATFDQLIATSPLTPDSVKIDWKGVREAPDDAYRKLDTPFLCLAGAGDSTETTIEDTAGYALTPLYNIRSDDADLINVTTGALSSLRSS